MIYFCENRACPVETQKLAIVENPICCSCGSNVISQDDITERKIDAQNAWADEEAIRAFKGSAEDDYYDRNAFDSIDFRDNGEPMGYC